MIIKIPGNIKSNFEGYNYLCSLYGDLSIYRFTNFVFDFKNVGFIEANLSAFIGAIFELLESNNNTISFQNFDSRVLNILRKNLFLIQYGFPEAIDNYDTTLVYKKFNPNADKDFYEYIQNQLLSKPDFPPHSEQLGKKISENIFELYENARTHGLCNYIHVCGQFFPQKNLKPLHFTIVDKGVTIKENVANYLNRYINGMDAIEWAMQVGNTTKTGSNPGGLGLGIIFEFIEKNKGKIDIVSSDGYYEFSNNNVSKKQLDYPFDGTMVNLRFNLNDKSYYSLIDEEDFENIF